jgi:hypothetical protein
VNDWQMHDWNVAVDLFTGGKWSDAHESLSQLFADDPVAKCLMRVMDKTKRKTPAAWDGSFVPPSPDGG